MEDLISRSALIAWENNFCADCTRDQEHCSNCIMNDVIKKIKDTPAVDAELVRHGHWIKNEAESALHVEHIYDCSACHNWQAWGDYECTPYCPNCGAKMDKVL